MWPIEKANKQPSDNIINLDAVNQIKKQKDNPAEKKKDCPDVDSQFIDRQVEYDWAG